MYNVYTNYSRDYWRYSIVKEFFCIKKRKEVCCCFYCFDGYSMFIKFFIVINNNWIYFI